MINGNLLSRVTIFMIVLINSIGLNHKLLAQDEDVKAPLRLFTFTSPIDYKQAFNSGVLSPDKIYYGSFTLAVGMNGRLLIDNVGSEFKIVEPWQKRSVNSQLHYLNKLAQKYPDSMHYYIFSEYYYDKKLEGNFRVIEWDLEDVGKLRSYLWQKDENSEPVVWLFNIQFDSMEGVDVKYIDKPGLSLVRSGKRRITWDVEKNIVYIEAERQ